MTASSESSLASERLAIRSQLQEQRHKISAHLLLNGMDDDRFPRSVTMRVLIQHPVLVFRLARLVFGRTFRS